MDCVVVVLPKFIDQFADSRGSTGGLLTEKLLRLQIRFVLEEKLQEEQSCKEFELDALSC